MTRPSAIFGTAIADRHDVPYAQLMRPCKTRKVVYARQEYWFRLVFDLGYTLPRAGRVTGHDHTTVLYGIRRFAGRTFGAPMTAGVEDIRAAWFQSAMEVAA